MRRRGQPRAHGKKKLREESIVARSSAARRRRLDRLDKSVSNFNRSTNQPPLSICPQPTSIRGLVFAART